MTPNPECTCKPGWMKPGWVNCRCPVHGDCNCEREPIPGELNEFECPVHYSRLPYRPSTPPPCPNCERLEADLEREQEAGLLRKADLAFAHECVATAELCRDGFKVERDNVTARLWRFVQDARMTLLCFDGEYGEPSPAQRKACISLIQDTLESIKEIAE